jgi:hypothetical protein
MASGTLTAFQACKRLENEGYKFQKTLSQGKMRSIAFALDPDGYWVEIIGQKTVEEAEKETTTDTNNYLMVSLDSQIPMRVISMLNTADRTIP